MFVYMYMYAHTCTRTSMTSQWVCRILVCPECHRIPLQCHGGLMLSDRLWLLCEISQTVPSRLILRDSWSLFRLRCRGKWKKKCSKFFNNKTNSGNRMLSVCHVLILACYICSTCIQTRPYGFVTVHPPAPRTLYPVRLLFNTTKKLNTNPTTTATQLPISGNRPKS